MDELTWTEFKSFVNARNLPLQWREDDDRYYLLAFDGPLGRQCWIHKTAGTDAAALAEFEASYKAGGNQPVEQRDSDKTPLRKTRVTSPGWHYGPRCMTFTTATRAGLHNRKHDGATIAAGTDYADATLKFYDGSGTELVQGGGESDGDYQTRLTANCIRTELVWTPSFSRDIVGGILKLASVPAAPAFAWFIAAPHIPEGSGGSVPYVSGGVPLHVLGASMIHFDGRGPKRVAYDNVYYSHRFALVIKHAVGEAFTGGIFFEDFVA